MNEKNHNYQNKSSKTELHKCIKLTFNINLS